MSKSQKKIKQEITLTLAETAEKLHSFAHDLINNRVNIDGEMWVISPETPVKMNMESKGDRISLKIKFQSAEHVRGKKGDVKAKDGSGSKDKTLRKENQLAKPSLETGDESFKDLKKSMSQSFKALMKLCVKDGIIPDSSLVESFYKDSCSMCDDQGDRKGPFVNFRKEVETFYRCYQSSDHKKMCESIRVLNQVKKECHGKFK